MRQDLAHRVDQALSKALHDVQKAIPESILAADAQTRHDAIEEAVRHHLMPIWQQETDSDMEIDQPTFVESSVSRYLEGTGFRKEMVQILVGPC